MTHRRRLETVLKGEVPDCVPCCPDISNMVPCRLTGKPFWDIYLYHDPPLWKAYIDAVKYFGFDGGFELYDFGDVDPVDNTRSALQERIIFDSSSEDGNGRIVTRRFDIENGSWQPFVTVYTAGNPPGAYVRPESIGLPPVPDEWKPVVRRKEWPEGRELWELIRRELGEAGILGLGSGMKTALLETEDDIISYYEDSGPWKERSARMMTGLEERMRRLAKMEPRPDFLFCGASGTLITQTPGIVRELTLPLLKKATELAAEIGIPTHIHSCGPEKELVRMAAEETALTVIDPLEVPPMGDCVLSELKQKYGGKLVLKGNLHTTQIMLNGSPEDVREASKKAIDDAAEGGGFILSTGDQCGRDTPDANLFAMIETAYTYGKY